jgi:hypothetical protein
MPHGERRLAEQKVHYTMQTTTTALALLVMISGPLLAGSNLPGSGEARLVRVDSAHSLFTPNAPDAGRAGQIYQLPGGGFGVTTGGTSHYQTLASPGGSSVAIPNGNNTFDVIGSAGRSGIGNLPR